MQYKNFILDKFQEDSIAAIERGHSVVVSAATGTGKTLIADYLITKYLALGKRIIYTAPIKALSNQKYRDFKKDFGEEKVGIMTGDIVINSGAPVLIMTTEIFRNMLLTRDEMINDVHYIVFDEIHYINDIERGVIWEESIIFAPEHMRFLCLSATIPNAEDFATWIKSIKKHEVEVVTYEKRAVPLAHFIFDAEIGMATLQDLKKAVELDSYPDYYKTVKKKNKNKKKKEFRAPYHIDLIKELKQQNFLPCLFFVFSRDQCEMKAKELYSKTDFTTPEEKKLIIRTITDKLNNVSSEMKQMESVRLLRQVLSNGIGIHHAGLLPILKEIVEILFSQGLIKVLYATETFAVGINMPAKSVAFNSMTKYDGVSFRFLNSKEYFQLAGRAGRRGIDKEGIAVAMIDRRDLDLPKLEHATSKDIEPIISQFRLTYNTVLNMINNHTQEEIDIILKSSFDYYLKSKKNKNYRINALWTTKVNTLKKLGYVNNSGLTDKGLFATHIYSNEILITELFCTDAHQNLTENEILAVIASFAYEGRRGVRFEKMNQKPVYNSIMKKLAINQTVTRMINQNNLMNIIPVVTSWADGCDFPKLMEMSNLSEGDYIRLFRQIVDFSRQIRRASQDFELEHKLRNCMDRIYRDVVKPDF